MPGDRAVFVVRRSLALRPRLATGLPVSGLVTSSEAVWYERTGTDGPAAIGPWYWVGTGSCELAPHRSGADSTRPPLTGGLVICPSRGKIPRGSELPAAARLQDEDGAAEGPECEDDAKGLRPDLAGHSRSHRTPALRLSAVEARATTTSVKRARFAFNAHLLARGWRRLPGGRAVSRIAPRIPGFASPPRDGFALDGMDVEQRPPLPSPTVGPGGRYQQCTVGTASWSWGGTRTGRARPAVPHSSTLRSGPHRPPGNSRSR
jgi:hypothetical protein